MVALALQTGCSTVSVERLETALAARDSATAALRDWCEWHGIASPARIVAEPVQNDDAPRPATIAADLSLAPVEAYFLRDLCI